MRDVRTPIAALLAATVALTPLTARADHDPFARGFDAVPTKHTPSLDSGFAVDGARLLPTGSFSVRLLTDLNTGLLSLREGDTKVGNQIPFRADLHLLVAYQLHQRIELGADLPFTAYQWDNLQLLRDRVPGLPVAPLSVSGFDDLRGQIRIAILQAKHWPLLLTAIGEFRLPMGGGDSFLGDATPVLAPRMAAELKVWRLRVLGNLGMRFRQHGQWLNLYVGNELTAGATAIFRLPFELRYAQELDAIGEVNLATPLEAPFTFTQADSLKSPFGVMVGLRGKVFKRFGLEVGVGRGVTLDSGYGRESFRFFFGLSYTVDKDTEIDTDNDGVGDGEDNCPTVPEDLDGFQDDDGCPEPDNDGDGVLDAQDQCPTDPGPAELDGCPDRDGDEVPDNVDKCPDVPGAPEKDGCPYEDPSVVLESDRIRVRGNILFETGSAKIQRQSFKMLDEVYKVLADNPEIGPVRVEGHTDNRGSRPYNLDLSDRRAKSVVDYLVKKGIASKRLRARGFGFDKPVAPNATPLGRAKNRRVEFNLVQPEDENAGGKDSGTQVQQIQDITAPTPGDAPDAGQ